MWRLILLAIVFVGLTTSAASAQVADDDEEDIPVIRIHEEAPEVDTVEAGEDDTPVIRIHEDAPVGVQRSGDDDNSERIEFESDDNHETNDDAQDRAPIRFSMGYVDWQFVPAIEVLHASGAVTDVDAQRTLEADQAELADCFVPEEYPGGGAVEVDMYLAYNGVPQAVNGTADGMRPNQARCILKRAWRYQFPRIAENADEQSRVGYRVEFIAQPIDPAEREPDQAHLFLERLQSQAVDDEPLRQAMISSVLEELNSAVPCAAGTLDEMPNDLVATHVKTQWQRTADDHYRSTDLDITVTNMTSSTMPSQSVVNCYERVLRSWQMDLADHDELPDELNTSFYITVRPPGWQGR